MSPEGIKNMFSQIDKLWIAPEVEKRRNNKSLPSDFKIFRCLIRLPQDKEPIVEFNDEISLVAEFETAPGEKIKAGDEVYLHQVKSIKTIHPPKVDEKRVA